MHPRFKPRLGGKPGGKPGGRPGSRQQPRAKAPPPPPPEPTPPVEVTVERLGARGDGVARLEGKPFYLPLTLPGERVLARVLGQRADGIAGLVETVLDPAPERGPAACRHYGTCGGCRLQHLVPEAYRAAKRDRIAAALGRYMLKIEMAETRESPPGSRRRAAFAARRTHNGVILGFNEPGSPRIVDLGECPVLEPALVRLLPELRVLLGTVLEPGQGADAKLLLVDGAIDLVVEGGPPLDLARRETLALAAERLDLARIAWAEEREPEIVVERRPVRALFAGKTVPVPPGAFLQATAQGEAAIVAEVLAGLADGPVLDLFAGLGTLSLPIAAAGHAVTAAEGDAAAVAALRKAGIAAERRDLERRPFEGDDLARFSTVVFDPPRTGAAAQAKALADNGPEALVAVSCHPESFARDAATLGMGGYRLDSLVPIDQFLWSPHIELVARFRRT